MLISLPTGSSPALDTHWFTQLQPLCDELFTVLGAPHERIEQYRTRFEATPFNPDLRPLHLAVADFEGRIKKLTQLKDTIQTRESHEGVRQAYIAKIDELIKQNEVVIASLLNDRAHFADANRSLYGQPDALLFAAVCDWLRTQADQAVEHTNVTIAVAAKNMLQAIPKLEGDQAYIIPDERCFQTVRTLHFAHNGYIDQLFEGRAIPDSIFGTEGDDTLQTAIRAVGSTYSIVDSSDELWGVLHDRHAVARPLNQTLSRAAFMGIIAHEVGSHLLERENGLRQPLQLLSIGLDRYESSNEGRAFLREQIMYDTPHTMTTTSAWEYIVLLYFACALSAGLAGEQYDFRSLYEAILPICTFFQTLRYPHDSLLARTQAMAETWNLCVRICKGTDGTGGAYLKSQVYLSGNITSWQLAAQDAAIIFLGDEGKFDIARSDHRDILRSCAVL